MKLIETSFNMLKYIVLCSVIFLGCKQDDILEGEEILNADFTMGKETFSFSEKLSNSYPTGLSYNSLSKGDVGFFVAAHFQGLDRGKYLDPKIPAKQRAEWALEHLKSIDGVFVRAVKIVSGTDRGAFNYYVVTFEDGYSLSLIKNLNEVNNDQIWTTAYGGQTNSSINIERLRMVEVVKYQVGVNTYNVVADISFSCNVYNQYLVQQTLTGKTTIVLFDSEDKP